MSPVFRAILPHFSQLALLSHGVCGVSCAYCRAGGKRSEALAYLCSAPLVRCNSTCGIWRDSRCVGRSRMRGNSWFLVDYSASLAAWTSKSRKIKMIEAIDLRLLAVSVAFFPFYRAPLPKDHF